MGQHPASPGTPEGDFAPPRMLSEKLASYARAVIDLVRQQQKEWEEADEEEETSFRCVGTDTRSKCICTATTIFFLLSSSATTPSSPELSSLGRDDKLEWERQIYDEIVRDVPVSVGSAMSMREREEDGLTAPSFVYGEIPFMSLAAAFQRIRRDHSGLLEPGGHFLDVGSGTGKALVAAALLHKFQSCTGIEILESLHEGAMGVLERWRTTLKSGIAKSTGTLGGRNRPQTIPCAQLRCVHGDIVAEEKLIKAGTAQRQRLTLERWMSCLRMRHALMTY